jgi:thioredoxin reductase (NADPH)
MTFFTTSERLEVGDHPFTSTGNRPTREEALAYYRGVVRVEQLAVRTFTRLTGALKSGQQILATLRNHVGDYQLECKRLVLATGYLEQPNLIGVPGESMPHVSHWFEEPHRTAGRRVVVVGGKNSAVEAALQSWRAGANVTLVYRGTELPASVKYWLRPDFENRMSAGEITAYFNSNVTEISAEQVRVQSADGVSRDIPADRVFLLTGYHPDFELMQEIGIAVDDVSGMPTINSETLETNVPGVFLAGSAAAGRRISQVFIENGRLDGEKIFGDPTSRAAAEARYASTLRPTGE